MTRRWAYIFSLILAASPAIAGPRLGKYLCVTDFSAGIVTRADGSMIAGPLGLAPDRQRFFATIQKNELREIQSFKEECFSARRTDVLRDHKLDEKRLGESNDEFLNRLATEIDEKFRNSGDPYASETFDQYIDRCLTYFDAQVANYGLMSSTDGHRFFRHGSDVIFTLFDDGEFHLYELDYIRPSHPDSVYRGRCEFIQ